MNEKVLDYSKIYGLSDLILQNSTLPENPVVPSAENGATCKRCFNGLKRSLNVLCLGLNGKKHIADLICNVSFCLSVSDKVDFKDL